jgi:hypothetical protein
LSARAAWRAVNSLIRRRQKRRPLYLSNGGKLEVAQQMANHESARTTGLYDRQNDQVSLDEVERILI